jgi:uncharacterized protein YgiM (DUF1202 family)
MGMTKRTIEKSAEATLNIGDMQFLKIRTAVTEDVEAEDEAGFSAADTKLWEIVSRDIRRGMWTTLKTLGKTTDADKKFFETCSTRVQEAKAKSQEVASKTQQTEENTNAK